MLVYSSMLHLMDRDPRPAVLAALRSWIESKVGEKLSDEQLRQGRHAITPRDLLEVEEVEFVEAHPPAHRRAEHDWATAFRYSHPDSSVPGRRWITEIGLSVWSGTMSYATVRLQTEEQSALAYAPITTTRPRVTSLLLDTCRLHGNTPGGAPREVRQDDVDSFESWIRDRKRHHPVLLIRCRDNGLFSVSPARVAEYCVGIAEVAFIATLPVGREFPRRLGELLPEPGGLHILWPAAAGHMRTPKTRMLVDDFDEMTSREEDPAAYILARVCHETNAKVAGWHVDLASVRTLRLQFDLRLAREHVQESATAEQIELLAAYEQCEKDDKARIDQLVKRVEHLTDEIVAERAARDEAELEAKATQRKADALEQALRDTKGGASKAGEDLSRLRESLDNVLRRQPTLEDSLIVLDHMFPDRLVVLDTAWSSARAAGKFRNGTKAFDLLWKLCTGYHEAMCSGGGDKQATSVFGNTAFAARESETVENNKKACSLRRFTYRGEQIEMMRHLKIGVKPSDATTFRAHFHWDAEKMVVVLGHCGGHLDHD